MRKRKILSILLTGTLCLSLSAPVLGAEFSDGTDLGGNATAQTADVTAPVSDDAAVQGKIPDFADGEAASSDASLFSSEGTETNALLAAEEETGTKGLVYEYVKETDSYRVVKGVDTKEVAIPETYEGKPVLEVAANAFVNCSALEKLTFKNSNITVHSGAFRNCPSLLLISVNGSIRIDSQAFTDCHKLSSLHGLYQESLDECSGYLKTDAFDLDSKIVLWTAGSPLNIPEGSFITIELEDGLVWYDQGVTFFDDDLDTNLDYGVIDFDNSRASVDFSQTHTLQTAYIYRKAFYGSDKLEEVILNNEFREIQTKAFAYCTNLKTIDIPSTVTDIADDAFIGCNRLTILTPSGSYAEKYARAHNIPVRYTLAAPAIKKVQLTNNMVTVQLHDFIGDSFSCVLATDLKNGVPVLGKNSRIAAKQTGNKVIFRNVPKGIYYVATQAAAITDGEEFYSQWSDSSRLNIQVETPARPKISSARLSGRRLTVTTSLPTHISGYNIVLSKGITKSDNSTAAADYPKNIAYKAYGVQKRAITSARLKPGTYYLSVQSYLTQNGKKIYSQWAPAKRIVVK